MNISLFDLNMHSDPASLVLEEWAYVEMLVVTRDIPEGVFAAGNSCRVIREITE